MTTTTGTTSATATTAPASSLGSTIITSLSAGAGIDTDAVVTGLTAAQKSGTEAPIIAQQTANAAQISAVGSLSSEISAFSSSLTTLVSGGSLQSTPTSSDASIASATAIAGARLGNLSSTVRVTSLAIAQTLQSGDLSSFTSGIAATTLTIATAGTTATDGTVTGARSTTVTVPANASVRDVATAINAARTGVTASVITTGGKSVLVLKGTTGAANAFSVASGDAALATLTYGAGASADSTQTSSASAVDAVFNVDGVDGTSASNTLTNLVAGVTLTLVKAGTVTLTGTRPINSITQAVNAFVADYNTLKGDLDAATAAATSSTDAGALRGNATIRDLERRLGKLTTTKLTASGAVTTLAQLGVATARDGTLSVNATTLATMLATYPDDVEALFNPAQTSSSSAVTIASKTGAVAAGVYTLSGITAANGTTPASGSIDGVAAKGLGSVLSAAANSAAAGLTLVLGTTATLPASATLTIDLGLGGALALIANALVGTNGAITSLQAQLATKTTSLADQLAAADARVTVYHDRLVSAFSTMNTRVSAYKATQSYLTQQVDLWTKSTD